jgi:hypothetical protein
MNGRSGDTITQIEETQYFCISFFPGLIENCFWKYVSQFPLEGCRQYACEYHLALRRLILTLPSCLSPHALMP